MQNIACVLLSQLIGKHLYEHRSLLQLSLLVKKRIFLFILISYVSSNLWKFFFFFILSINQKRTAHSTKPEILTNQVIQMNPGTFPLVNLQGRQLQMNLRFSIIKIYHSITGIIKEEEGMEFKVKGILTFLISLLRTSSFEYIEDITEGSCWHRYQFPQNSEGPTEKEMRGEG